MRPQISDDDNSASESEISISNKAPAPSRSGGKRGAKKSAPEETEEPLLVDSEDEEDDGLPDNEFVVEKILNHFVDDATGELQYKIKWEGYEKKSDITWEPEENLESASKLLNEYLKSVGGKDLILADWAEKKALAESSKKGKKRGRSSPSSVNNSIKRTRKSIKHPASTSPPASAIAAKFEPPSGSWEEEVIAIDACEGTQGNVIVYLTWKGGHKSQHPLAQIYKRCPQKMLKFYEDHLVFKKSEDTD